MFVLPKYILQSFCGCNMDGGSISMLLLLGSSWGHLEVTCRASRGHLEVILGSSTGSPLGLIWVSS
eukprot:5980881-Karenia_brevis.AAC.1